MNAAGFLALPSGFISTAGSERCCCCCCCCCPCACCCPCGRAPPAGGPAGSSISIAPSARPAALRAAPGASGALLKSSWWGRGREEAGRRASCTQPPSVPRLLRGRCPRPPSPSPGRWVVTRPPARARARGGRRPHLLRGRGDAAVGLENRLERLHGLRGVDLGDSHAVGSAQRGWGRSFSRCGGQLRAGWGCALSGRWLACSTPRRRAAGRLWPTSMLNTRSSTALTIVSCIVAGSWERGAAGHEASGAVCALCPGARRAAFARAPRVERATYSPQRAL
jgi:hypothetical protein